jgi:hypothetical protein
MRDVLRKADAPGWYKTPNGAGPESRPPFAAGAANPETPRARSPLPVGVDAVLAASIAKPKPPAGTDVRWSAPAARRDAITKAAEKTLPSFPAALRILPQGNPETRPESLPASRPTLSGFTRLWRKVRRWFGLPVGHVAPRCRGTARNGSPCRAPSMDNGFCRMHGGKRERSLVEMMK